MPHSGNNIANMHLSCITPDNTPIQTCGEIGGCFQSLQYVDCSFCSLLASVTHRKQSCIPQTALLNLRRQPHSNTCHCIILYFETGRAIENGGCELTLLSQIWSMETSPNLPAATPLEKHDEDRYSTESVRWNSTTAGIEVAINSVYTHNFQTTI